ncbi:MAG: hypothetical protein ACREEN_00400 [Stellaceae bacterium]
MRYGRPPRSLSLEQILVWTYRDQHAHRYLRSPYQWFIYMIEVNEMLGPDTRRPDVHRDAATVHSRVVELNRTEAHIVVDMARAAHRPEIIHETPRYRHVDADRHADDYGRARIDGELVDYKIKVADRIATISPVYRRRGRKLVQTGQDVVVEEVKYCPVYLEPDPAWIATTQAIYQTWAVALAKMAVALRGAEFVAHEIYDVADYPDPDVVANDPSIIDKLTA